MCVEGLGFTFADFARETALLSGLLSTIPSSSTLVSAQHVKAIGALLTCVRLFFLGARYETENLVREWDHPQTTK